MPATKTVITITTDGSGNADVVSAAFEGWIDRIIIDYGATVAATCDLTLSDYESGATLLTRTDTATDGTFRPVATEHANDGTDNTTERRIYVSGAVRATVAQGGDAKEITIDIWSTPN